MITAQAELRKLPIEGASFFAFGVMEGTVRMSPLHLAGMRGKMIALRIFRKIIASFGIKTTKESVMIFFRSNKTTAIVCAIAFLVFGAILITTGSKTVSGLKDAKQIEDTDINTYEEGMWVKGKATLVWDWYCNETTEKNGTTTENFRWYFVEMELPDSTNGKGKSYVALGVKVPAKDFANYEKLKTDEPEYELTFQGKLEKCTGEILDYKKKFLDLAEKDYMDAYGMSLSSLMKTPDFYVDLTTTKTGSSFIYIGIGLIVIAAIIFLVLFLLARKKRANEAFQQQVAMNAYNNATPEPGVGASTGFYMQGERDELSQMLAEEDQKVSNYNFENGLTGSDHVEDDKQ